MGTYQTITPRHLATMLAALRYWQREGRWSCGAEQDIASDCGKFSPMSPEEIDDLCETLNVSEPSENQNQALDLTFVNTVAGKRLPVSFAAAVALLVRPYIPISEAQYEEIAAKASADDTDILVFNGLQMTFGAADGGFALMPLIRPI